MALQSAANMLGNQAIKGMRMVTVRYGPAIAAAQVTATQSFARAAKASRQFRRDTAIEGEDPLTEEEQAVLEEAVDEDAEPRKVRVCYQTTRMSRGGGIVATGVQSPIALFAHWCLEVDGMYYELRTHDPSNEKPFKGRIIYEEPGLDARKIKLQVSTDRVMHPSAEFSDVSTTILDDDKILWAATLIFAQFGKGYDLFIDNCQLFSQLLAEAICGQENRAQVRKFFEKKSIMKLPVVASWLAAPLYGTTNALHYALNDGEIKEKVSGFLNNMEEFYYHPRVYAGRRGYGT